MRYHLSRRVHLLRIMALGLDVGVAVAAFLLAYMTAHGTYGVAMVPGILDKSIGFAAISLTFLIIFSVHRGSWRYVSIPDLVAIIKAGAASVLVYTMVAFVLTRGSNVPRSVPILCFLYMVAGMSSLRLLYRLYRERTVAAPSPVYPLRPGRRNILLYGLNDNAESFIRAIRRGGKSMFNVVGILDDNIFNQVRTVQGVRVLGNFASLRQAVEGLERSGRKVSELVITEGSPSRERLIEVVELAASIGLKASRIPLFTETSLLTSGSLWQPKAIEIGDLLGRPEIVTDLRDVAQMIGNKIILVTGAGGSIGSELCRQIAELGPRHLVITDHSEFLLYLLDTELREKYPHVNISTRIMSVRDNVRISAIFDEFRPDGVFHAAALKHVPLMEANPLEAIKTNLLGTRFLADAAVKHETANFVMISTDKAVNPTSVMGATKRAAEAYCQSLDVGPQKTRFKTVRFGNVLGSNGSVVPRFQEQIQSGGPITVTHPDIVRFFMTIPEAVRLVLNAAAHYTDSSEGARGKIMVLDMGEPVRIVDLAERMIQLAGLRPNIDVDIAFTGLRPGEKLYEELFDPSEIQEKHPGSVYFIASPRIIDAGLLHKTLSALETAVARGDQARAIELLHHIVPEYGQDDIGTTDTPKPVKRGRSLDRPVESPR